MPKVKKLQYDIGGCDFVSSMLSGEVGRALAMKNMTRYPNGAKGTRPGSKVHTLLSDKCFGIAVYENPTSGDELVVVGGTALYRITQSAITVTYGGAGTVVTASVIVESGVWRFKLVVDGTTVLNYNMGVGYDEASIKTLSNLKTAVDAVSGFSMSVGADGTTPCAFLEQTITGAFSGATISIPYWYQVAIPKYTASSNPFADVLAEVNSSSFIPTSFANISNTLWISPYKNRVLKYDGVSVYIPRVHNYDGRAELDVLDLANPGALTLITGATVMATYKIIDRQRNLYETDMSDTIFTGPLSNDSITVYVAVGTASPFTTRNMLRNAHPTSNQSGVTTITVDDGSGGNQQLLVGDYAYFLDRSTSTYVERRVTAVTNTTITIEGAAVNVKNNDVISNNVRVVTWRTKDGGSLFYKMGEYPISNLTTIQQLPLNDLLDSALGEQYVPPVPDAEHNNFVNTDYQWPQTPVLDVEQFNGWRSMTTHQGLVVVGGCEQHPKLLRWSDLDAPEYFPLSNYLIIEGSSSDLINGVISFGGALLVLRQRSVHAISGDFLTGRLRADPVSKLFGCMSSATIKEIDTDVYLFLSERGIERLDLALNVTEVSQRISSVFSFRPTTASARFVLSRARALVDKLHKKYILFVPVESTTSSQRYPTSSSRVFEYDYQTGEIWEWDSNINMAAGAAYFNGELWWASRVYSSFDGALQFKLHRRIPGTDDYVAVDHVNSILTEWEGQWEHGGDARLLKQGIKHTLHSLDQTITPDCTVSVQFYKDFGEIAAVHSSGNAVLSSAARSAEVDPKPVTFRGWKTKYSHNTLYKRLIVTGFQSEFDALADEVASR